MNKKKIFAVIVSIALLLGACSPTSTPTLPFGPEITPLPGSIGRISPEERDVESGTGDNLSTITQPADFFNNSTVRVTNGGVAKLDFFNNQISIRLFNDTSVDDVKVDTSGTNNFFLRMKLAFGGLSGEVTKGGKPVQVELTNGANIYILGTQFLVLYDPVTGATYIGNFDGTIAYALPGRSVQFTQERKLYEISSNLEVKQSPLTFTRTEIETRTSNSRSTLLDTLQDYLTSASTPTPTMTLTQVPTLIPTSTPTITPTPTKIIPCNKAAFVTDVTIPDGTSFSPGFQFAKVWRLKNVGICTWTNAYSFFFYRGDQMSGPASVNLSSSVAPGQSVDISVGLVAPALPDSYRGDWMLQSPSGASFGAGPNGTTPFWIKISVTQPTTMTGKDGMTLLYVPAGEFTMGSNNGDPDEAPVHTVYLDAFWIDQTEVTNAMYARCVEYGGCSLPHSSNYNVSQYPLYPVVDVTWDMAKAYCDWASRRLPTEAEWEKAARGTDARTYPWGNDLPNDNLANYDNAVGDRTEVGKYPNGASPYGALDMAGNAGEWVNDWYDPNYYQSSPPSNPQGPSSGVYRVLRGGSWNLNYNLVRSADRSGNLPAYTNSYLGFRCSSSP